MDNWKNDDTEKTNTPESVSDSQNDSVEENAVRADASAFTDDGDQYQQMNDPRETSFGLNEDSSDEQNASSEDANASGRAASGSPYVDGFRPAGSYQNSYSDSYGYTPYRTPYTEPEVKPKKRTRTGLIVFIIVLSVFVLLFLGGFAVYGLIRSDLGASLGLASGHTAAVTSENPIKPSRPIAPESDTTTAATTSFVPVENAPTINIITPPQTTTAAPVYEDGMRVLTIQEIAVKVKPSVVGVVTAQYGGTGLGSGIIMSTDGYILTNAHVVENGEEFKVILDDGTEHEAALIGADKKSDIAILKIEADNLPAAEFGDSDALVVGDMAVAIGNPSSLELSGTTTSGIISAVDREIIVDTEGNKLHLIQTDAAINPGNSGGPLLNRYGQVIGINTVKISSSNFEGLGFAIPTNVFKPIVDELFQYGQVHGHPGIGIIGSSISSYQSRAFNIPMGVYITTVQESSDAFAKGIQAGDIITAVNGETVASVADINLIKNRFGVGDTLTLSVYRNGETFDVEITLMDDIDIN